MKKERQIFHRLSGSPQGKKRRKRKKRRLEPSNLGAPCASQIVSSTTAGLTFATTSSSTLLAHVPVTSLPCYPSNSKGNASETTDFSHQYWCPGPDDDGQPCMCSNYRHAILAPLTAYNQANHADCVTRHSPWNVPQELSRGQDWSLFHPQSTVYQSGLPTDATSASVRELSSPSVLPPPSPATPPSPSPTPVMPSPLHQTRFVNTKGSHPLNPIDLTEDEDDPVLRAPTPPSVEQLRRQSGLKTSGTMEAVRRYLEEKAPVLTDQTGVIDLLVELVERQFVQVVKPAMAESGEDWDRWEQRYLLARYYKGTNPAMGPRRPTLQQVVVEGGVEYGGGIMRDKEFPVMVIRDTDRVDWDRIAAEMQELCRVKDSRYTTDRCRKMWILWYQCQMDLREGFQPLRLTPEQHQRHQNLGSTGLTELPPFPSIMERLRMNNARFREVGKWEEEEIKVLREAVKSAREKASKWSYSCDQVGLSTRPGFGPVTLDEYYEQGLDWEEVSTQSLPWRMPKDCAMAAYSLLL